MAILFGTQSNGETLPVLVDQYGNLLAKGIEGPQGPPGNPGTPGVGELPPDPYEGALLGWLNNELAWIGTPPVPIPEGRFGPISGWDPAGLLTVEGDIPSQIKQGVYVYQCNEDGTIYVDGWNNSKNWSTDTSSSGALENGTWTQCFDGTRYVYDGSGPSNGPALGGGTLYFSPPALTGQVVTAGVRASSEATTKVFQVNGTSINIPFGSGSNLYQEVEIDLGSSRSITTISTTSPDAGSWAQFFWIAVDGALLADQGEYPSAPNLNLRVQSINGQNLIGSPNRTDNFSIGKYLRVPEQNVARWLYDGNLSKVITSTGIDISRLTEI